MQEDIKANRKEKVAGFESHFHMLFGALEILGTFLLSSKRQYWCQMDLFIIVRNNITYGKCQENISLTMFWFLLSGRSRRSRWLEKFVALGQAQSSKDGERTKIISACLGKRNCRLHSPGWTHKLVSCVCFVYSALNIHIRLGTGCSMSLVSCKCSNN